MRKYCMFLFIALAVALFASVTLNQVSVASAQQVPPVGIVVAYVPGQSITIMDKFGNQHEYMLSPSLKILPPGRQNSLAVGSFVTIIAPASFGNAKQTAVGIVVHPHVPNGWNIPALSATPFPTGTALATFTATPTGTLLTTETTTSTSTATSTPTEAATATATSTPTVTAVGTSTATPTATATATPTSGATVTNTSLIEWLRTLFTQLLTNR